MLNVWRQFLSLLKAPSRRYFPRIRQQAAHRRRAGVLRLEELESRLVLSLIVDFTGGELMVTSDADDSIVIDSDGGFVRLNGSRISPDILSADVTKITAQGGPLDNLIDVSGVNPADFTQLGNNTLFVFGGAGADTIQAAPITEGQYHGNDGDDSMSGNAAHMHMFGEGDNDSIFGGPAGDPMDEARYLIGGDGDDTLTAGGGAYVLRGGNGNDTILGGAEGDTLEGGTGQDTMDGGGGDDFITGGTDSDADLLIGGPGNDNLRADDFDLMDVGPDTLQGNEGDDFLQGDNGDDSLDGGIGNDALYGGGGSDILNGDEDDDVLVGSDSPYDHDNVLNGGSGNDILTGGGGVDNMIQGGRGTDRLVEAVFGKVILNNTQVRISSTVLDDLSSNDIESVLLTGGPGNDTLDASGVTGDAAFNGGATVVAGLGITLDGGGGNDSIIGSTAADLLVGGLGNDTLRGVGGFGDILQGGTGIDTVQESRTSNNMTLTNTQLQTVGIGSYQLSSIEQADLFDDTGHIDASAFTLGYTKLTGGLGANQLKAGTKGSLLTGGSGADTLTGGAGADTLVGGIGNDCLVGAGGTDALSGESGNDTLLGGDANDTLTGDTGNDSLNGGSGTDRLVEFGNVNFSLTNVSLTGGLGTDAVSSIEQVILTGGSSGNTISAAAFTLGTVTLNGGGGNDVLIGGSKNDKLFGNEGNDTLAGVLGNDMLDGGAGTDRISETQSVNFVLKNGSLTGVGTDALVSIEQARLFGGASANTIDASQFTAGSVTLSGGGGNDTLKGGSGDDCLVGSDGNDSLLGNAGNDTLSGGLGTDTLNGGTNTDTGVSTLGDTFSSIEVFI